MANENSTALAETAPADTIETKKSRTPRRDKKPAQLLNPAVETSVPKAAPTKQKKYNDEEKAEILAAIESDIHGRKSTLKDAVIKAGISEQTYRNWKHTDHPSPAVIPRDETAPAPASDEFADLLALEEENQRLRKLLAEKLRSENADLRRRLGLD